MPVPDWVISGNFTAHKYNATGTRPNPTSPGPSDRRENFFAGGPSNASSSAAQSIDVSADAAAIDAGEMAYDLSGYLGGWQSQEDNAVLKITFKGAGGEVLGTASIGPVTAADRGSVTGMVARNTSGRVPVGTRQIDVLLQMTRTEGDYNDGYADNLSLVLTNDTDGDGLSNKVETEQTNTDPNNKDTDEDGLLDPWEVDPATPGAGFDLDGDGVAEVSRDEVFGPYAGQGGADATLRLPTPYTALVGAPDPLHKDLYLEIDWQDCLEGGCPEFYDVLPSASEEKIDPTHHAPNVDGLKDLQSTFANAPVNNPDGQGGVNLHILIDERLEHQPVCDQNASSVRNPHFGTKQQRGTDVVQAKEKVFRYAWSGHSVVADDAQSPDQCALPEWYELVVTQGLGLSSLPSYDYSPYGDANANGRDILVSLGPLWICPTQNKLAGISTCYRGPLLSPHPGIFPATVDGQGDKEFSYPMSQLMGVPESEGSRHLWGRTLARLLGVSLGISRDTLKNDPNIPVPDHGGTVGPDSYADWSSVDYAVPDGEGNPVDPEANPNFALQDRDLDGDGVLESEDNCPGVANPGQDGTLLSRFGAACWPDDDGDGLEDPAADQSQTFSAQALSQQTTDSAATTDAEGLDPYPDDTDNDGLKNGSDPDIDGDGVRNASDNCASIPNAGQEDTDSDGEGNACDADDDGDGFQDRLEKTVGSNLLDPSSTTEILGASGTCADGVDNDRDGQTDAADSGCADADGDSNPDLRDSCPNVSSRNWLDRDGDGVGDACDDTPVPENERPSVTTARTWSVLEDGQRTLTAQAYDPEGETLTFEWDLDADGTFEKQGQSVTFDAAGMQGPISKQIAVQATDPASNSATARSTVNVLDVPAVTLTSPEDNAAVSDIVTLSANATAEAGVESVEFLVDGTVVATDDVAPYEAQWDTTSVPDGQAVVSARATDTFGIRGISTERTVTIDNAAPGISIDLSAESDTGVSSTDNITNDATPTFTGKTEAGSTVEIYDGTALLGKVPASDTGDWSFTTDTLADGVHPLSATAVDAAGNTASAKLNVTIDTVKPATRPPKEDFTVGSQLGTSAVPVKLLWSATDGGSGVVGYELEQSLNGAAYSAVNLPTATTTSLTSSLAPNRAYQYRVHAQDKAGNVSNWAEEPPFKLAAYQENSSAVTYPAGTWTRQALSSAYGGYVKYATAGGARAKFTFIGREVAWVAPKGPNRGKAEVLVDGTKVATIDLYSATGKARQVVFRRAWATSGNHTVVVRATGTKNASSSNTRVDIDAFLSSEDQVLAEGTIKEQGITGYMYGDYVLLDDQGKTQYALRSSTVELGNYVGQRVQLSGSRIPGYPVDGGPDYLDVTWARGAQ